MTPVGDERRYHKLQAIYIYANLFVCSVLIAWLYGYRQKSTSLRCLINKDHWTLDQSGRYLGVSKKMTVVTLVTLSKPILQDCRIERGAA
jgi:hypothetical protein